MTELELDCTDLLDPAGAGFRLESLGLSVPPAAAIEAARSVRPAPQVWALAVAGGVVLGVASELCYRYLPGQWRQIGNSAALWVLCAFVAGATTRSMAWGAAAGACVLGPALGGFYPLAVATGLGTFGRNSWFWMAAVALGAPLFGFLGALSESQRALVRGAACASLGAAFVSEALVFRQLPYQPTAVMVEVLAGVILPFVVTRDWDTRGWAALWLLPGAATGVAVWSAVNGLYHS